MAVVLLSGAGLLIRSFVRVQTVDRGFDSRHLLLLQVALPDKYDDGQDDDVAQRAAYFREAFAIYGVIHQSVVARTQEIGVRMAIGASKASVLRMILSGALGLSAIGVALGMAGALALAQTLSSFLYETSPLDPLIYIAVAALLVMVTAAACLVPAYRATKVDPMTALRYE